MRSFFVAFFIYFLKYSTILGCFPQPNISNDNEDDDTKSVEASDNLETFIGYYANEAWAKEYSFPKEIFPSDDNILYIMAFNVGQANCIILRKGQNVVIVDAGGAFADDYVSEKAMDLISGCVIQAIFISHPHEDHFSLLLTDFGFAINDCTKFYLGGFEEDWYECLQICQFAESLQNEADKALSDLLVGHELETLCGKKLIRAALKSANAKDYLVSHKSLLTEFIENRYLPENTTFCGDNGSSIRNMTFLDDVTFEILDSDIPNNPDNINQKSFLLKVTYYGKSILFTGDSEGESIDRHIKVSNNINQSLKLLSIMHMGIGITNYQETVNAEYVNFYNNIVTNYYLSDYFPLIKNDAIPKNVADAIKVNELRENIKNCQLIFLPHHGSNKNESQRWLGFFSNDGNQHCFVISSSAYGKDALPKRSNLEMAPNSPVHYLHPFVYAQNTSYTRSMMMTKKPSYVTGSEPGGVACFRVVKGAPSIEKFDAFNRGDGNEFGCRWFAITE